MPQILVPTYTEQAWIEAVVTRCGCDPATFDAEGRAVHTLAGRPCPNPRAIEDRGVIAYYHRNPLRRLAWRIRNIIRGGDSTWRPS